jgi:uncharacterized protein (TIGR00730 family)
MRRICVYCGSSPGGSVKYAEAAEQLAAVLVRHDLELVYGGASRGTMGVLADAVLERGGAAHGVIPKMLEEKEIAHAGLTKLHVVASMHERKSMMAALSDGFIALPGGFGTLEELIEILTWPATSTNFWTISITLRRKDFCARKIAPCCFVIVMQQDCCGNSSATRRHVSKNGRARTAAAVFLSRRCEGFARTANTVCQIAAPQAQCRRKF